jgi:hypothetical protein
MKFCINAAQKILGRRLSITEEETKVALSAENFVNIRTIYGGTAPVETKRALSIERGKEESDTNWFSKKTAFLREMPIII